LNSKSFVDTLNKHGIDFFTGIPDSLLCEFCDELVARYGTVGKKHIVAHNEGGSVALASGYYLARNKIPCVYMQNSGIGNALNPITSLTHQKVYGIPILYVIGWRGEPGIKDEPQHLFQGASTLKLLTDMEIEYFIIDKSTPLEEIDNILSQYRINFIAGKSLALVVRQNTFCGNDYKYCNNYILNREQAISSIVNNVGNDVIVATTGKISRELFEVRKMRNEKHEKDFLTVGSMGHCIMIALGIALQLPKRRVWCLDGDGSVLMHMGSMSIVGYQKPEKFIHIMLNNAAHDTVGGMPTVADNIDFQKIAEACGYTYVYKAEDIESLKSILEQVKMREGLFFIEVLVALGSRPNLGRPSITTSDNKNSFMDFLTAKGYEEAK